MATEHPFQVLFETLGRVPAAHAEPVNRRAYEILSDILTVPVEKAGRCVLLRAPRAGHGKTHLLSRIQHQLGSTHEFVPLHAAFGSRIDAGSVTDDTLRRLVRQLPASGGLTVLDLVSRRLFASALQPLVASGEVPCQDREGALAALRNRPIETFDFHHPNAVTAHWARENFEVLGQRLSLELAQRTNLPVSGISFWVDVLFLFAAAPLESSNRVRILAEAVHGEPGVEMERLEALLGLLTLLMRVVLVADDLEGFSTDETAALRLAAFLGSLRQTVERLDVILSLNLDIWESAFMPRLSGGLADRLSEVVVELEPLTEIEMEALLDSRVPGLGRRVLDRIDLVSAGTHARGLIRAAGMAWLKATAMDSTASPAAAPVVIRASTVAVAAATPPDPIAPPGPITPEPVAEVVPVLPQVEPEPVVEESAVLEDPSFSDAAAAEPVQAAVEWPAPVFAPPSEAEVVAEPSIYHAPIESPFQLAEPAVATASEESPPVFVPEKPAPAPLNHWNPPTQVLESTPVAPVIQPQLDSPFQSATREVEFEPATPSFEQTGWRDAAHAAHAAPTYAAAPVDDFIVPVQDLHPVEQAFQSTPSIFEPQQNFSVAEPVSTTVNEPTPAVHANPQPVSDAPALPSETTPPASAADTDRVDDLLRQFRERYGRGSL